MNTADHTTESHLPPENIDHEGGGKGGRGLGGRNDIIQRKGGSSHLAWCICWQVCISKWETIPNLISHSTSLKENCFVVPRIIFVEYFLKWNTTLDTGCFLFVPPHFRYQNENKLAYQTKGLSTLTREKPPSTVKLRYFKTSDTNVIQDIHNHKT